MKKLEKSDLEIGDILIFEDFDFSFVKLFNKLTGGFNEAFYYLIDYLIAWFDPGKQGENYQNFYHAGIWGYVDINLHNNKAPLFQHCVVQAGSGGIGSATLEAMLQHDEVLNIYVCRLKKQTPSFHEDINQSINYFYKEKGNYSFKTAWLLAVICSMRYSKASMHKLIVQYCGSEILAHFMIERILYYINEYNDRHQREMIACSPLVAMMYKNAGHELSVNVFESLEEGQHPKPKFDLAGFVKWIPELKTNPTNSDEWPPIKETVVTPRQLFESPDVEVMGYLPHMD